SFEVNWEVQVSENKLQTRASEAHRLPSSRDRTDRTCPRLAGQMLLRQLLVAWRTSDGRELRVRIVVLALPRSLPRMRATSPGNIDSSQSLYASTSIPVILRAR